MFRRLRAWAGRAPRIVAALALLAFVAPAVAGPLEHCLHGDDAPRVVAAFAHCEMMAEAAGGMHFPAVDDAATAASAAPAAPAAMALPPFLSFGEPVPAAADRLPPLRGAYGGAQDLPSLRSLAGAIAGGSVRLLI